MKEATKKELSKSKLCEAGFNRIMRVVAESVYEAFRKVYESLGADVWPLELEGNGLFDCMVEWMESKVVEGLSRIIDGLMSLEALACERCTHFKRLRVRTLFSSGNSTPMLVLHVVEAAMSCCNGCGRHLASR